MNAVFLFLALSVLPADPGCGCPSDCCACKPGYCLCFGLKRGDQCEKDCCCEIGFVKDEKLKAPADAPKAIDTIGWHWRARTDGVTGEVILVDAGGKDVGGYHFGQKVYRPLVKGEWGDVCPCPVTPPMPETRAASTPAPTYYYADPFQQGGSSCGSGGCGGTSSGRGLFRRR